jgi:hypothetical protein
MCHDINKHMVVLSVNRELSLGEHNECSYVYTSYSNILPPDLNCGPPLEVAPVASIVLCTRASCISHCVHSQQEIGPCQASLALGCGLPCEQALVPSVLISQTKVSGRELSSVIRRRIVR